MMTAVSSGLSLPGYFDIKRYRGTRKRELSGTPTASFILILIKRRNQSTEAENHNPQGPLAWVPSRILSIGTTSLWRNQGQTLFLVEVPTRLRSKID